MSIRVDKTVDAKGLACPMPIVRTKKALDELEAGQVLELQATDKGSLADIQSWAKTTGHQYLGSTHEEDVLHHFIRKSNPNEVKEAKAYPHTISNDELLQKLANDTAPVIVDVREPAEYAFNRIPGAISIPFGELEQHIGQLNPEQEIYMVCRTGNRSDMAAQLLSSRGFNKVMNVIPGMSEWNGPTEKN
ncbi:sulfurtransferase TusA family protein [Paenibacillus mendelii]|uniref:Sulfurtransferase TusA family protein n=1 Tax=Paenibacillus mendelii TaxID=206163 RepID=A0ABV6JG58_9BACL|nr:sulfurtransferase TusA family protein [Paenibacillus mendelii]MCQ6557768.1 sulfurtransferase TusA family protein [Paenibacillus mendelii]